jgi:hypothetical protein
MMDTQAAQHETLARIRSRLGALRRAVRVWFWVDGVAALCVTAVGLAALSLLVDYTFRMDRTQRALCLVGGAIALGVLAWRRLVRPLSREMVDDALGLVVEARHGDLRQRLISGLQLARLPDAGAMGYSPAMIAATIEASAQAAEAVAFPDVLDRRRRSRNLLRMGGAVTVCAAAAIVFPATMGLWFSRNVLLGERAWPQDTHLRVLDARDGVLECPRGDDLGIHVEADPSGVVPSVVTIRFRSSGGLSGTEPMVRVGDTAFRTVVKNVVMPFQFRVSGGDATTAWHEVRLVERPAVDSLVLGYEPPAYVGHEWVRLPSNLGPHRVPRGSTFTIEGVSTKDLAEATLAFGKRKPEPCQLMPPRRFRAVLAGERLASGAYAIGLEDTTGYEAKPPARLSLRVVGDLKPNVRAKLEGIGDLIVPQAVIPVACRMTDDYAVVSADIVHTRHVEGEDAAEPQRLAFGRPSMFGSKEVAATHRLEAEPLGLDVGTIFTFRIEARDNDMIDGPKVGVSGAFSLRVVTEDELRAELLRREQEQRMEFERLLRDQQKLLENTRAFLASIQDADTSALSDAERRLLGESEKKQRLVGNRCIAIANRFAAILAEFENNKLEERETAVRVRLGERIMAPLRLLARRGTLEAADRLDTARKAAIQPALDATPGHDALVEAAGEQERILEIMRNILKNMVKWEGYQEAVSLLREVLKAQRHVSEQTLREYRNRIEKIFDD